MSFDAGFLLGLSMGGGGGGSDEWSPPADWPIVPEPDDYDVCLLVAISKGGQIAYITLTDPQTANTGIGSLSVDWGDGTTKTYSNGGWTSMDLYHSYEKANKYVIKITTTQTSCFFQSISCSMLIAKLGKEIIVNNGSDSHTQRAFYNQSRLQYIKFSGKGGLTRSDMFRGDYGLQKVDIAIPPTVIPPNTFMCTTCLRKFDFSEVVAVETQGVYLSGFDELYMPKCISVDKSGIADNASLRKINLPVCNTVNGMNNNHQLQEVNLPKCTSAGDYAFTGDYSLTNLTISSNCTFGTNCFSACYNLEPHPDGTDT